MNPTPFIVEMARMKRGEETLRLLQAKAADPKDVLNLDARFELLFRYRSLGDIAEERRALAAILAADGKGATIAGARAQLIHVMVGMAEDADDRASAFDRDGERLAFRGGTGPPPPPPTDDR